MKFGSVPLSDARGGILAHSVSLNGKRLAKGTTLGADHLDDLRAAGWSEVVVARLDTGDVEENAAAAQLAKAIVPDPKGQGLRVARPATGRVNLYAEGPGVVQVDVDAVHAINAAHPMITLATVPAYFRVDARSMVATIKVISYGVPSAALDAACAATHGALRVVSPQLRTASLIETQIGKTPPGKGRAAMAGRLERMGVTLAPRIVVPHETAAIAEALSQFTSDLAMILTASATSDPDDVAPSALRQAGGIVERFGMPVDPGNLLFIGALGECPVIGLPGCARSPALNGADWVLERIICGLPVQGEDIAAMGVGGLLKEIPTRPKPRREAEG